MKNGDLVWFPCDAERYQRRVGIFLGCHDNRADVDPRNPSPITPPRQVAEVLYQGKLMTCWAAHIKKVKNV